MEFEDGINDPYQVLGLPFGSPIDVCLATFKSLAKIYHPDIFNGDKEFAESRMSDLNSAIEFLRDSHKKAKFDFDQNNNDNKKHNADYEGSTHDEEYSQASQLLKENWEFACEYYPEIKKMHSDLQKLDKNTAFIFMATMVENKLYDKALTLVNILKKNFLSSKFGNDEQVLELAEYAILNRQVEFAKSLNKALKILGEGSKNKIFEKLLKDFPDFSRKAFHELHFKDWLKTNPTGYQAILNAYKDKKRVPPKELIRFFQQEFKKFEAEWIKKDPARKYMDASNAWHAFLGTKL